MTLPTIKLAASDGQIYKLADFTETEKILLYFYPKDNTPGCTKQAVDFTELKEKFSEDMKLPEFYSADKLII